MIWRMTQFSFIVNNHISRNSANKEYRVKAFFKLIWFSNNRESANTSYKKYKNNMTHEKVPEKDLL